MKAVGTATAERFGLGWVRTERERERVRAQRAAGKVERETRVLTATGELG